MRRLVTSKSGLMVLALLVVAALVPLFRAVTLHLAIVIATLVGALLAHTALTLIRRSRFATPSVSVVPGGLDRTFGSPRRQLVVPAELPPPPGALEGRDEQIDLACAHLSEPDPDRGPRLIVVHGEPGVGKTAFAIKVAHLVADDYPDGQLLVRFDPADGELLDDPLGMLVYALKSPKDRLPDPVDRGRWYGERTGRKRVLVILDNIDDVERIRPLLPSGRHCAAIVTSPIPLPALPGGHGIPLAPLSDRAATQLLDMLVGGGRIPAEPGYAAQIVAAARGYPVALHMAGTALAVRRNWTLEIAVRRMGEIAAGRRHATSIPFAGVLDLAYALLTEQERTALVSLGALDDRRVEPWMLAALLRGGFPGEGEVTQASAARLLDRLSRARFAERRVEDSSGQLTFRVPEHVRGYARTQVDPSFDGLRQAAALRAVHEQRQRRAERSTEDYLRRTVYRLLDEGRLDEALNTARESLAVSRDRQSVGSGGADAAATAEEGLTLAALGEVYAELGWIDEGLTYAEAAIQRSGDLPHVLARALRVSGSLQRRHHLVADAVQNLRAALREADRTGDELEQVRVLSELASALALGATPDTGELEALDARRRCESAGHRAARLLPGVLLAHARALHAGGNLGEASRVLSEAEKLTAEPESGQQLWRSWIRLQHALVSLAAAEFDQSRQVSLSALEGFTVLRHRYGSGHARLALGRAYLAEGSFEKATPVLEESNGTFRRCGDRWIEADSAVALADAYQRGGRGREAIDLLSAAEQTFSKLADERSLRRASHLLWTVESSLPSERLRLWPVPKGSPDRAGQRPLVPAVSRAVNWPAP